MSRAGRLMPLSAVLYKTTRISQKFFPPRAASGLVLAVRRHYLSCRRASALLVNMRQHSSGLKQIRGGWRCQGPGLVTWLPPVHTGPRELDLYGRCGARHISLNIACRGKATSQSCCYVSQIAPALLRAPCGPVPRLQTSARRHHQKRLLRHPRIP